MLVCIVALDHQLEARRCVECVFTVCVQDVTEQDAVIKLVERSH